MQIKTAIIDGKRIAIAPHNVFEVQISKGKGAYRTVFASTGDIAPAAIHYSGLNVHSGYNKRLICQDFNKPVIARFRS